MLNLTVLEPTNSLKRRVGETVSMRVLVSGASRPLVEVWTALHDPHGQPGAITLRKRESRPEGDVYGADIVLKQSGYFPLQFRAREEHQAYWQWCVEGDKPRTITLWVDPAWVYDAIVYNAFVRYFGAKTIEGDGEIKRIRSGTFRDINVELRKLHAMGINVLYLNPVHQIGELYRNYNPHDLLPAYLQPGCPYSVKDYRSVDPELSFEQTEANNPEHPFAEFRKLVAGAHALGMRVVMDLVFNHAAHDAVFQRIHPEWFLYKQDITSLEQPYIYPHEIKDGKPWGDSQHTFCPYDHGYWWKDTAQLNWNNIPSYPDFIMPHVSANAPPSNPTIDDMYTYFKNIVKFWIREFGIDGFRCDVAYRVPLSFWKECIREARAVAKEAHPHNGSVDGDVVFIAEDYHVSLRELLDAGFTACYGDYSNKLGTLPDITGYLDYMYNISGAHFPDQALWFIFPECHDFHRNPTKIAQEWRREHKDADLNANKSRWTMTACLPGIPMIFNGFEKMEWEPADLFSYSTIDWESDKDISEHIARVNHIRRASPVLQRGSYYYLHTSEGITPASSLFAFARILGDECMIVVVNLNVSAAASADVYLPDALPIPFAGYVLEDLLHKKEYRRSGASVHVVLEAGESHIFRVRKA